MAKICLCLTGKTLSQNLETLEANRRYIDLAELRVDFLDPDERFLIRRFPEMAGLPVILTVRRKIDGGCYEGGEGARVAILSRGLAFAEIDRRHNFAYVDFEEDLDVPGLEEAVRTFGTRIIRSFHNLEGVGDVSGKINNLRRIGDEIAKAAVTPRNLGEVLTLYRAAKESRGIDKIILGMGSYGANTRILAEKLGSFLTYCSASNVSDNNSGAAEAALPLAEDAQLPAAPGQLSARELVERYRFRETREDTKIYAVTGFPLKTTFSPRIFNTVFSREKIDAVYVPFPAGKLEYFLELAKELDIRGVSVTIPYKEEIIPHLSSVSDSVRTAGACNTVRAEMPGQGWSGINTDTLGFSESLLTFMGRRHFRGRRITIIGAGGAARAVAAEVHRLKGKCLILNRNASRARELALAYGSRWGGLDSQSLDTMERYSDIIIQTTPAGTFPNIEDDPFPLYQFLGHETVMDLIYNPPLTAFLKRAEGAGCNVLNGFDMLVRQAKYQYEYFFDRDFPDQLIPRLAAQCAAN